MSTLIARAAPLAYRAKMSGMTTPPSTPPSYWVPPPPGQVQPGWTPPRQMVRLVPAAPNGAPLADFWYRLGAYMIDSLIIGAFAMILIIPATVAWIWYVTSYIDTSASGTQPAPFDARIFLAILAVEGVIILFVMLISYLYLVEYQLKHGQTVGKRVLKIKIVPADPRVTAVTRGDLTKRWAVFHVVGTVVPFFSYIDGLWQLWDKPLQQCLHDKAAKTVVIRIG
jgi:uncharacterized RDD family membrane protein YckC